MSTFDEVFAIMQASFPLDEYRPRDEQHALLADSRYRLHTMDEEDHTVAFAATWDFGSFLFVEHLAVAPQCRNRGLGAALLARLQAEHPCRLCLEVELPQDELSRRRIGFYKRCGFTFNEHLYTQPPISRGRQPVPLRLMSTGGALTPDEFTAVRDTLYKEVYHVTNSDTFV